MHATTTNKETRIAYTKKTVVFAETVIIISRNRF